MSRTQHAFNSGDLAFQEIITSRPNRDSDRPIAPPGFPTTGSLPRLINTSVSQDYRGTLSGLPVIWDQLGTIVSACVGRSAMPTYRHESDGTNFVFTLTTEIIARSAELPQGQFPFHFPH